MSRLDLETVDNVNDDCAQAGSQIGPILVGLTEATQCSPLGIPANLIIVMNAIGTLGNKEVKEIKESDTLENCKKFSLWTLSAATLSGLVKGCSSLSSTAVASTIKQTVGEYVIPNVWGANFIAKSAVHFAKGEKLEGLVNLVEGGTLITLAATGAVPLNFVWGAITATEAAKGIYHAGKAMGIKLPQCPSLCLWREPVKRDLTNDLYESFVVQRGSIQDPELSSEKKCCC